MLNCYLLSSTLRHNINREVNINVRNFKQTCHVMKNQRKIILKKPQDTRNRGQKKSSFIETKPQSQLTEHFQNYLKNLILGTCAEREVALEKERLINSSIPIEILELRGLCIDNLIIDSGHNDHSDNQDYKVRFRREGNL